MAHHLPKLSLSKSLYRYLYDIIFDYAYIAGFSSSLPPPRQPPSAHLLTLPRFYLDQPLPPPPPFNGRHMLPPSPPQNSQSQQGLQAASSQRPPPPPPFSGSRELPALSNAPRPGSSMSISSMLGTDPGRPARESISYSNPPVSAIISTTASPSLPTQPPTRPHNNSISTHRSHSPDTYKPAQGSTTRPFRAYSGGSPRRPTSSVDVTFPNVSKYGTQLSTQPQYSPSSDIGPRQDWKNAQDRHQNTDRITQRPNSQPNSYSTSHISVQDKLQQQSTKSEIDDVRRVAYAERYHETTENKQREAATGQTRRIHGDSQAMSEPRAGLLPDRKLANTSTHTSPIQDRPNGSSYPFLARSAAKPEAGSGRFGPQPDSILNRVLERNPPTPTHLSQSPFSPESLRRLREERLVAVGAQHNSANQFPANQQGRFMEHADAQQEHMYPRNASVPANLGAPSIMDIEHQGRTGEEMNQLQKNSLSLFMENQKRAGRVSPLPQAVQGAQGKISTPASEPGIKSEFAKMFIGIGSGVGSAGPTRSETSTPFQRSPVRNQEPERRTPLGGRSDLAELNKPRTGSRGGKGIKKLRDEETKVDIKNGDGRASAVIGSSRGVKSKSHQYVSPSIVSGKETHISSHHTTIHHHHHDELGNPILHHHHHHLDQHHHRHGASHQPKTPAAPPTEPTRTPKTIIKNDALLKSIKGLPRHHLGSTLYSPAITSINSPDILHTKLGYTSTPKPIPRFDGQENCTFTVRVPRFFLTAFEREDICRRRTLWGSGVYTDDSDPLAAAIHAGWIRGDWGENIDLSMLSMTPIANSKPASSTTTIIKDKRATQIISSLPSSPLLPPAGKDLHLTLLILPCLESYASTTAHGIKSRAWGGDHDGVSFSV